MLVIVSPSKILLIAAGIVVAGGCGGDADTGPSRTTLVAKILGDGQIGTVGQVLTDPIRVLVIQNNSPLAGVAVTWSTTLSQGALTPDSQLTDADGMAATEWTLGPFQGLHTVTAKVTGATTDSVNFTATAQHDLPVALLKVTGDNQTAPINTTLSHIQARVVDRFENGIPGLGVSWSVSTGTVSPETDVTDPSGLSSVLVTLGDGLGPVTITATADVLPELPVTFAATAAPVSGPAFSAARSGR